MTEYERGYADGSLSVTTEILDEFITQCKKLGFGYNEIRIMYAIAKEMKGESR